MKPCVVLLAATAASMMLFGCGGARSSGKTGVEGVHSRKAGVTDVHSGKAGVTDVHSGNAGVTDVHSGNAGVKSVNSSSRACRFDWRSPKTYVAACNGDLDVLKALAHRDASIDEPNPFSGGCPGWRPIMIAAAEGKAEAVKILLEKGADPNVTNAKGRTALMFAARYGYDSIVDDLLNAGAKPDITPPDGPKAIVAAGMEGKAGAIIRILRKGGAISAKDCEPPYQDGCVRVGMVLATVMNDLAQAKAINEPLCAGGYERSCAVVAVSDCLLKFSLDGKGLPANLDPELVKACARPAAHSGGG